MSVAPPGLEKLREAEAVLRTLLFPGDGAASPVARLRLPDEAATLFAAVEAALAPPEPGGGAVVARDAPAPGEHRGDGPGTGFGPDDLAAMERGLAGADLSMTTVKCRTTPLDFRDYPVRFTAAEKARLREAYPERAYGTVLPFKRTFVVAHREDA